MQSRYRNPLTREDTLFGVCQAIGEDFSFDPLYLRVALSVSLLWSPTAVIAAYFALGFAVLVARLVAPYPKPLRVAARGEAVPVAVTPASIAADNSEACQDLAVAA